MDSSGPSSSNDVNEDKYGGGSQQYNPHTSQDAIRTVLGLEDAHKVWEKLKNTYEKPQPEVLGAEDIDLKKALHEFMEAIISQEKEKRGGSQQYNPNTSQDAIRTVLGLEDAYKVWEKLKNTYHKPQPEVLGAEDIDLKKALYEFIMQAIIRQEKEKLGDEVRYIPLHRAIQRGDWDKAQEFFNNDKPTLTAKLDDDGDTALHLAIDHNRQNPRFVENLLKEIPSESLPTLVNNLKRTTLHRAAQVGNTNAAKMLVEKNPCLLFITDVDAVLPVLKALLNYQEETFRYLVEASKLHIGLISQHDSYQNPFEGTHGSWVFGLVIDHGYIDLACPLLCEYPVLAINSQVGILNNLELDATPLKCFMNNQDLFFSATRYNFYQRFIYSMIKKICDNSWKAVLLHVPHIKHLQEEKLKHKKAVMILERICEEIGKINNMEEIKNQYCGALNSAVLKDNREAVEMIIRFFPNAIWTKNDGNCISQVATKYRCEMVLNFLEDQARGGINLFLIPPDNEGNRILHLAGRLAPTEKLNLVSGAALQMQREVWWFKRIEKCVLPLETEQRNKKGQTPIMVFREEHKNLRKEGEEWMKKTSDSYTITAALIITIVFAAAITVPGGNDQNTGKPMYKTKASFIIFAISDAISLFTSTTSLLLFLSILTARYHEDDFLYKLPKRLILGLVMLFLSVTSMMVAFGATLYIMFGQGKEWILIPIVALACLPIASYVILQYPMLCELVSSTYGHEIYNKRNDRKNK